MPPDQRPPHPAAAAVKKVALFLAIMIAAFVVMYEIAVYLLGSGNDVIVTAVAALSALLASMINDRVWRNVQRS
ncbi:MAG TPA: hypothetical protein VHN20_13810 [Beijerinckiaceae bacterium]|nr:hypothetical protein [Beijerinckiaceae bacterium]